MHLLILVLPSTPRFFNHLFRGGRRADCRTPFAYHAPWQQTLFTAVVCAEPCAMRQAGSPTTSRTVTAQIVVAAAGRRSSPGRPSGGPIFASHRVNRGNWPGPGDYAHSARSAARP